MRKGTDVKFILYVPKDGHAENLLKPKAFSVYTEDQTKNSQHCARAKIYGRQEVKENKVDRNSKGDEVKQRENYANNNEVFWDIEDCRPKNGKVLDIVQQVRHFLHRRVPRANLLGSM